jgi:hypothetical protein
VKGERVRGEVAPLPGSILWTVTRAGMRQATRLFKFRALEYARAECRYEWENHHLKSELMVKDRSGRYTAEGSTYGRDPPEIPG